MAEVAAHIGLSPFDFLSTVSKGKYNVEGHEGYEKVTSWQVQSDSVQMEAGTREYLTEYFKLRSEEFFSMIGKRCAWQ